MREKERKRERIQEIKTRRVEGRSRITRRRIAMPQAGMEIEEVGKV